MKVSRVKITLRAQIDAKRKELRDLQNQCAAKEAGIAALKEVLALVEDSKASGQEAGDARAGGAE